MENTTTITITTSYATGIKPGEKLIADNKKYWVKSAGINTMVVRLWRWFDNISHWYWSTSKLLRRVE